MKEGGASAEDKPGEPVTAKVEARTIDVEAKDKTNTGA
jgi:hypothetical protein